jgi:two-component system sensor histidine kinase AtoS
MKNGLVPIRNVLRHLSQVQERTPHELATVFGERRATLESSVSYLDDLAMRWTRLAPRPERITVDVNAIVRDIASTARDAYGATVRLALAAEPPMVAGDPLALRRVVDNLVINALQSLDGEVQGVTVSTERRDHTVRLAVADTGRGMSQDELSRALGGFYTTKPHGTGLGLSVVRRLIADHGGMMRIDTAPRRGTTVVIELPLHSSPPRS